MSRAKYAWAGNRIADSDMAALYRMKKRTRKPITEMVAEAVSKYVKEMEGSYEARFSDLKKSDNHEKVL